ncbi:MAG: photosystem II biogenesis protein Psp29 [Cyanobacteria bacterium P01_E01_bin.34]
MNTVRTVSSTKAAFQQTYQRPINSVYRRFVEEFLTELHLVTVNSKFTYDPFFAMGMVKVYEQFMQGYAPTDQAQPIFDAVCQSLQFKPDVIRQDAEKLTEILASADRDRALEVLQLNATTSDIGGIKGILDKIRNNPDFHYSRTFLLGLYIAFTMVAPENADKERKVKLFGDITDTLKFPKDRVDKDLDLYNSNIEKLEQALAVMKDLAEAAKRDREKAAATPAESTASSEAPSENAPTPVE